MTDKLLAANPPRRAAWRVALGLTIAASLLGAAELTWGDDRVPGRPIDSVIRLLEGRSPGERNGATLTKLKKKVSKSNTEEPQERVLGKEFPQSPTEIVPPQNLLTLAPPPGSLEFEYPTNPLAGTLQDIPVPAGAPVSYGPTVGGGWGGSNGGGFGGGGSGGGPGGGPIEGGNTPQVPEVPAAVPEPETWALMLLGAALAAAALRRGKASHRQRAVAEVDA